jgi:hypothetical protein
VHYPKAQWRQRKLSEEAALKAARYTWTLTNGIVVDPTDSEGELWYPQMRAFGGLVKVPTALALVNEPPVGYDTNIQAVVDDKEVLFKTQREVNAGEELFVDYGGWGDKGASGDVGGNVLLTVIHAALPCRRPGVRSTQLRAQVLRRIMYLGGAASFHHPAGDETGTHRRLFGYRVYIVASCILRHRNTLIVRLGSRYTRVMQERISPATYFSSTMMCVRFGLKRIDNWGWEAPSHAYQPM